MDHTFRHSASIHHLSQPSVPLNSIPEVVKHTGHWRSEAVSVAPGTLVALEKAKDAVITTRELLGKGSANQGHDIAYTDGGSFRSLHALRLYIQGNNADPVKTAVSFRVGNCGEMATVTAALLAYRGIDKPVYHVEDRAVDHQYVVIGDKRLPDHHPYGDPVVADAWPLYSTAVRSPQFSFGVAGYDPIKEYPPQSNNPDAVANMENTPIASDEIVNSLYKKSLQRTSNAEYAENAEAYTAVGAAKLQKNSTYHQATSSTNPSVFYHGVDLNGNFRIVDQSVPQSYHWNAESRLALLRYAQEIGVFGTREEGEFGDGPMDLT